MIHDSLDFEDTPESITTAKINSMNELKLDVNNEDTGEFMQFQWELLSNEVLIKQQEINEIWNEREEPDNELTYLHYNIYKILIDTKVH